MDRFESMSVFVEIVRSGSLTATANKLGLSSSMVGKHLSALEARVGAKLLQRTTRRHHLTESGAQYFERCVDILDRVEAADDGAAALSGRPAGQLRIAAPISFGVTQLAPAMGAFLLKYPDIGAELVLTDTPVDPVGEGIDLAFRIGPLADSSLIARPLPSFYQMVVCASPDYLHRRGTPTTPMDLLQHDCLGHTRWGPRHAWRFEGPDGPCEVPVHYRLRMDHGPALREAALAGCGVMLQPLSLVKQDIEGGRLCRLLEAYRSPGRDFYLLYARHAQMPAKLRVFIAFALDHFAGSTEAG